MKARCDWCARLMPVGYLQQPLAEPGQESRWGAGRCLDTNRCSAVREAVGLVWACRLSGPSGCIRQFRTMRGRNQHERAHARKREAEELKGLMDEGAALRKAFAKQVAPMTHLTPADLLSRMR